MENRIKLLLEDLTFNSEYEFLEEGKNDDELAEIAGKRGIKLPSKDLSIFKCRYAMVDKENKNKCTLPRKEVKKALKTLIGKAIDKDHLRQNTVGYWLESDLIDNELIAYGAFWKSNFPQDYDEIKKRMSEGKLKVSFEAWGDREFKPDKSYDLTNIEFAGGALLFDTQPAFPEAEVIEFSKYKNKVLEFAKVIEETIIPEEEEGKIDITENYIRIRQKNPSKFEEDSFRTIVISKSKGIKAVIGRLKGKTTTTVQSYLFDKDKFTESEAKKWVEEHKGSEVVEEMEEAKFYFMPSDCMIIDKFLWDTECPSCKSKGMYHVSSIDFDNSLTKASCSKCEAKYTINLEPEVTLNKKGKKIKDMIKGTEINSAIQNDNTKGGIEVDELLKKYNKASVEELTKFLDETLASLTAKDTEIVSLKKEMEDSKLKVENAKIEIETIKVEAKAVKDELDKRINAEKAVFLKTRRDELGECAKDLSDEDITNDLKFENAKLKKELEQVKNGKIKPITAGLEAGAEVKEKDTTIFKKQENIQKQAFPEK